MKFLLMPFCMFATGANALTVMQDQGRMEIRFANLQKPYEVQLLQPIDCEENAATLETSEGRIRVKHRYGCSSGGVLKVRVNLGQDLRAILDAGSLELYDFGGVAGSVGQVSATADVGSVKVPADYEFRKTGFSFVGKSYELNGKGGSPTLNLRVITGALRITR